MSKVSTEPALLEVRLVKSPIGALPNHRHCVRGLGLRRIGHVVHVHDRPETRGMLNRIAHLLAVRKAPCD